MTFVNDVELICRFGSAEHLDIIWQVAWNRSGDLLASCSSDKTVRLWAPSKQRSDADEAKEWHAVCDALSDHHSRSIRSIAFSPNPKSSCLATASFDATVGIWHRNGESTTNQQTSYELATCLEGHENEVKCVDWSSDGKLLATCGRDKSVWIWEACMEDGEDDFQCLAVLQDHAQDVKCVKWHPSRELLASASYDNTIKLWAEDSMDDWTCVATLAGHQSTVWSLAFDPTGKYLISVGDDRAARLWRLRGDPLYSVDYELVCVVEELHQRAIYSVDWSPDGRLIATAGGDNCINILHVCDDGDAVGCNLERIHAVQQAHETDANCVRWRPLADYGNNNKQSAYTLASCSDDEITMWRINL